MRDEIAADSTVPRDIQPDKVPLQIKNGTATIGRFQVGIVEDDLAEPIATSALGDSVGRMARSKFSQLDGFLQFFVVANDCRNNGRARFNFF